MDSSNPIPWYLNILCGAVSGCSAELMTLPVDLSKVRLQNQSNRIFTVNQTMAIKYKGMLQTIKVIWFEEGPKALWKGAVAALQRQILFAGLRIGFYPSVRNALVGKEKNPTIGIRVLAGFITGAFGILVASPCDVVKVRLQAEGRKPAGIPVKYTGSADAYKTIFYNEGVKGFYIALIPNICRCSVMNSCELATYDQSKSMLIEIFALNPENKLLHFICATIASFVAVIFASPLDVMKTRIMSNTSHYKGTIDCFVKTFNIEGPMAFYNGFNANFTRVAFWNIIMFLVLEQTYLIARKIS